MTGSEIRVSAAGADAYSFTVKGHQSARAIAHKLEAHDLDAPL